MRKQLESAFRNTLLEQPWSDQKTPKELCQAAVLIPLIERQQGITILLTRRTDHLYNHPGQISFPGGQADKRDLSPVETALREAYEETGIIAEKTQLIGSLTQRSTVTGFMVAPVIGFIDPETAFVADEFEVAELLEIPLDLALDRARYRQQSIAYKGKERAFWEITFDQHRIWGATAGMLRELSLQLK